MTIRAMKQSIWKFIKERFPREFGPGELSEALVEHIRTPEFAALYREQVHPLPGPGMGSQLSTLETTMSKLTDAMTALGQQIAAANSTSNAAHLQAIDDHLTKLDGEEGADEATIADTSAGLKALLDAANGTGATGTPAPAPTPAP